LIDINEYASNKIKDIREKNNLTQQQLADKLHINQQNIARYELNQRTIKMDFLLELCKLFNVKLDYFVPNNTSFVNLEEDTINIKVLGRIPAGIPFEAIEDVIKYIDIPKEWTYGNKEYFGLLIDGNSMFPKYQNGDIVIFQKCEDHIKCNNKDCAVMVNGNDATFKKFIFNNNSVILQPYNMEYETKSFTPKEVQELPVKLVGFAVQIRRDI
jgi:lexA repressor